MKRGDAIEAARRAFECYEGSHLSEAGKSAARLVAALRALGLLRLDQQESPAMQAMDREAAAKAQDDTNRRAVKRLKNGGLTECGAGFVLDWLRQGGFNVVDADQATLKQRTDDSPPTGFEPLRQGQYVLSPDTGTGLYPTPDGMLRFQLHGQEVSAEEFCEAANAGVKVAPADPVNPAFEGGVDPSHPAVQEAQAGAEPALDVITRAVRDFKNSPNHFSSRSIAETLAERLHQAGFKIVREA